MAWFVDLKEEDLFLDDVIEAYPRTFLIRNLQEVF